MGQKTQALRTLCQNLGRKYVGFRGSPQAPIWEVGEAPGSDEDKSGYPFSGASGRLIDQMLLEAGFAPSDHCFTNPYKIQPPDNKLYRLEERGIKKEVFEEQFFEELEEYKPPFIVCNGVVPLGILCPETKEPGKKPPVMAKWRGSLLSSSKLHWPHYVIPNHHPAYLFRNWHEKDLVVFVHKKIADELKYYLNVGKLQPLPERQLLSNPTFSEAEEYLFSCLAAQRVSVDLELLARKIPFVFGLSYSSKHAVSLEMFNDSWTKQQLRRVWRLVDEILRGKTIIGQNFAEFDANWIDVLGFNPGINNCHDTRIRHHVLWAELPHSLQFMTMQYTREPYYKDEGRGWHLGRDRGILKRYNCKDAAVTNEVFDCQEEEFDEDPQKRAFYEGYELRLAKKYFFTDKRGIYTSEVTRKYVRVEVVEELDVLAKEISRLAGKPIAVSKELCKNGEVNLSSPIQLKKLLEQDLGIKLHIDKDTKKTSTNEESLNKSFSETGNPILKHLLRVRELSKLLGTYIDAELLHNTFYFTSSVCGTVGGRRSSKKNFLGYGSNAQNQPKRGDLAKKFREIYVAHPGHIFLACDQMSAEDWVIQGLIADISGDIRGVEDLKQSLETGISRHSILATKLFNLPLDRCGKETLEYYMGKKTRYAASYDMHGDTMSAQMASEGYFVSKDDCDALLGVFHKVEPNIRGVFHAWIQLQLNTTRVLNCPLGRSRFFFGLHPFRDNSKVYREAYSYIPQTTVGDNTGLAVLYLEDNYPEHFLSEVHDSALLDVRDDPEAVWEGVCQLRQAFHRTIRFQNGFEVEIPIEFELGYNLQRTEKCPGNVSVDGLENILRGLRQSQVAHYFITHGQH